MTLQSYATIAVSVLTLATLLVLIWYTIETSRLRRTAERQNEDSLRPILSLEFNYQYSGQRKHIVLMKIKNLGKGPAFNIALTSVQGATDAKRFGLIVKDLLAVGEMDTVAIQGPQLMNCSVFDEVPLLLPQTVEVSYDGATGVHYRTLQRLSGKQFDTIDGGLVLEFLRQDVDMP
jgi:hypothetical protein